METKQAYNIWAAQYDTNHNKTRDLEAIALRETVNNLSFWNCLEIGCGTGKNTQWLQTKADHITAVDLSEEMLAKAKEKIDSDSVHFVQADITKDWLFTSETYDLITFSLVLEHIENLASIFKKAAAVLRPGGYVYIGELHPFKQYMGTKARFDTDEGTQIVPCFNHHISDFVEAAGEQGLKFIKLKEYFDDNDNKDIPRILVLLMRKE